MVSCLKAKQPSVWRQSDYTWLEAEWPVVRRQLSQLFGPTVGQLFEGKATSSLETKQPVVSRQSSKLFGGRAAIC